VCVLFFIKELSLMCHIVISRLRIQFPYYSFALYHVSTPALIRAYHKQGFIHEKKIAGPDI
jgi:hypothetical protein